MRGNDELARVITSLATYERTYPFVGNSTYVVDGDRAEGEVYCTARHLTTTRHGANDFTMLIRYLDRYERGAGGWLIADRRMLVHWTELPTPNPPAGVQPNRTSSLPTPPP